MSNDSKIDMQRMKILSILPPNVELTAKANAKLFTSNVEGKLWLYSDLEGILCFLLDYQNKCTKLALFDVYSFEKLFEYELYKDFSKFFTILSSDFRCFEADAGFVGIQFDTDSVASIFDVAVKKFTGNLLDNIFQANVVTRKADEAAVKDKVKTYCKMIKQNWSSGSEEKYNEDYIEDGLEIVKARNFEVLNNISFDRSTKQFKVGEIPDELKNVFMSAGIRKKDLKDVDFAFNIYKIIIMGISGENKTTTKQIDYIPHVFDPPDEDGKIEGGNEVRPMAHKKKSDNKTKEVKKKEEKKPTKKIIPKPIVVPESKPLPPEPQIQQRPVFVPSNHTTTINKPQPPSIPQPKPIPVSIPSTPVVPSQPKPIPTSTPVQIPSVQTTSIPSIPNVPVPPPIPTAPTLPTPVVSVPSGGSVPSIPNLLQLPLPLSLPLPQLVSLLKKFLEKTN